MTLYALSHVAISPYSKNQSSTRTRDARGSIACSTLCVQTFATLKFEPMHGRTVRTQTFSADSVLFPHTALHYRRRLSARRKCAHYETSLALAMPPTYNSTVEHRLKAKDGHHANQSRIIYPRDTRHRASPVHLRWPHRNTRPATLQILLTLNRSTS